MFRPVQNLVQDLSGSHLPMLRRIAWAIFMRFSIEEEVILPLISRQFVNAAWGQVSFPESITND